MALAMKAEHIPYRGAAANLLDWDLPHPSRRAPVLARNIVATSQPLAAQAGVAMLQRGGNAVDAALATAIALAVVEPVSAGVGADAFAMIWDGARMHGLNGSGHSPRALDVEKLAGLEHVPEWGWDSVTVPGVVSAWAAMSEKFGRLPFADVFRPAIKYAREGHHPTPIIARMWAGLLPSYKNYPEVLRTYYPTGRAPKVEDLFRFPELADTLEIIAETEGRSFYEGALAEKIAAHAKASGAALSIDDLNRHTSDWVEPITISYRGVTIHELPPNGQGLAALIALGILDHFDMSRCPPDSADSIHLQIEATKLALADAFAHVGDPACMRQSPDEFLDPGYLQRRAYAISMAEARFPDAGLPRSGGTTYVAAADEDGMMVSYIQSCGRGFGSGIVVPGTGIALQSRGRAFTLERGHPNRIGPGKRPYHTNIPAFASTEAGPLACFGLAGWTMQPQAHVQFLTRLLDYGQNPQTILDAPRWRIALEEPAILLEPGVKPETHEELTRRGHEIVKTEKFSLASTPFGSALMFGGAQMIYKLNGGYAGASDSRRDGQAVGF
jgi:gamma-glutamyltranspeptidase / glutathione hydrolase